MPNKDKDGYCGLQKLLFAYTLEETVYAVVKSFYLCSHHILPNEDYLKQVGAEQVDLKEVIKNRKDL